MSDYSTPAVTDERTIKLAEAINEFADDVRGQIINVQTMVQETLDKQYKVNHEPQIELPFEKEYEYIKEKVNKSLASSYKNLDDFTHVFISGYLLNGKTIHPNSIEQDENGLTLSKYSQLYINGVPYTSDYTCRAEEGGWEKLNVLIIGAPKMSSYAARLDVDYADIPLKNFKMVVFDDLEETVNPDINSFLAENIDTLKYIGNLRWTYTGLCKIRRIEVTGNFESEIMVDVPCLQELIIPNSNRIPQITVGGSLVKIDISNVVNVDNINNANIYSDVSLKAQNIRGFDNCKINTLYTGDACSDLIIGWKMANKLVCGKNITEVHKNKVLGNESLPGTLKEIVFTNIEPLKIDQWAFGNLMKTVTTITFSEIAAMDNVITPRHTNDAIENISFTKPIRRRFNLGNSPLLTEQSVLNIINALDSTSNVPVALHQTTKNNMTNAWYCKEENGKYVSCNSMDEGAITQAGAIIAKGGTLA